MFMIVWYRFKVLKVLKERFNYEPAVPGWQSEIFNNVTRSIKKQGGNEYDGAIAFMLVMIKSLSNQSDFDAVKWKDAMNRTAYALMQKGNISNESLLSLDPDNNR